MTSAADRQRANIHVYLKYNGAKDLGVTGWPRWLRA